MGKAIVMARCSRLVLSQRADIDCPADPLDVYRVLRTINPSPPYMYCLRLADGTEEGFAVVGSSPETLMRLDEGRVTTFPIAGSRPRGRTLTEDREFAEELLADPRLSEHVMLVDLARNDLAKVCVPGTVEVIELMEIKRYSHIMHISSTVSGELAEGVRAVDCLAATFPAGTLSGA